MASDKWEALGKLFDLLKVIIIIGLIVAVGYGILNMEATLQFTKEAIELLKSAR